MGRGGMQGGRMRRGGMRMKGEGNMGRVGGGIGILGDHGMMGRGRGSRGIGRGGVRRKEIGIGGGVGEGGEGL